MNMDYGAILNQTR